MKTRLCQIMNSMHDSPGHMSSGKPACPAMLCAWALTVLLAFSAAGAAEDTVGQWQRWEHQLVSDRDYANPCVAVSISVRFDGPNRQARTGLGFWDGARRFVIRCAFPTPRRMALAHDLFRRGQQWAS